MNIHSKEIYKDREVEDMMEVTREEAVELLEKEKAYMIGHGGDRQVKALDMAIKAVNESPKTGKWIKGTTKSKYDYFGDRIRVADYKCSVCGRVIEDIAVDGGFGNKIEDYPYCHCGSRNEAEE